MADEQRILDVNRRYHDAVAAEYDTKWGIAWGDLSKAQVLGKVRKLLGPSPGPWARSLEIGAGTGYFTLNLMMAGLIESAVCTDVSPGMLRALDQNAAKLGFAAAVETTVADAGALPFPDASFDVVIGHAVLHHLPDLDRAWKEFARVLKPGGTVFFAGEPSQTGDRIASYPKRAAWRVSPLWRRAVRARAAAAATNGSAVDDAHALEWEVDQHAFTPDELTGPARAAGLDDVQVRGEELLASWFGWFNRTLEASAEHDDIPWGWFNFAKDGYLALQKVDERLLEPRLPATIFYNLMIAARKPFLA